MCVCAWMGKYLGLGKGLGEIGVGWGARCPVSLPFGHLQPGWRQDASRSTYPWQLKAVEEGEKAEIGQGRLPEAIGLKRKLSNRTSTPFRFL